MKNLMISKKDNTILKLISTLIFITAAIFLMASEKTINYGFRSGDILLQESFDVLGAFPEGWFIQYEVQGNPGSGLDNWSISNTVNAGGTAPELRFHFMPVFNTGYSRMVTGPIYVGDNTDLELIFKQRLSNYTTNNNEQIAVELSTDGANTWETLWFFDIFSSYGPIETTLNFFLNAAGDTIHIGFRFSGNSYNIFNWSIDDVLLRSTPQEDLAAGDFSGPNLLTAGQEYQWELEVFNNGLSVQTDYQIKLMKVMGEDDIELASAPGVPVEPGQTATGLISWLPETGYIGLHEIYGYIEFDDDQDLTNNASVFMVIRVLDEWATIKTVGEGKEFSGLTGFRIPFDFYYKNNLHQVIYYPEELDQHIGPIHGLVYNSSFTSDGVENEEVKLWIGMTTVNNFVESDGFIPVSGQTLVFHQNISIPFGESLVYLPLDEPFLYTGNNLIITSNRVFYGDNTNYGATDRYFSSDSQYSDRSIRAQSNSTVYNPLYPPPGIFGGSRSSWHPNTSFVFSTEGIGTVQGTVTGSGGAPLQGALIATLEYAITATSNYDGYYIMPNVPIGDLNLLATLFGYEDATAQITVLEGETTTVDFFLPLLQTISVGGKVTGSDQPVVGLADALVELDGYGAYEVLTDAEGYFLIEGVYSGKSYNLTISKKGFESYFAQMETGVEPIDLGTITLQEIALPPEGLRADMLTVNQSVVFWYAPGAAPYREFRYDDGTVAGQLGYDPGTLNSTLGAVWRNEALIEEVVWYQTNAVTIYPWVTIRVFGLDEEGYPLNTNVIKRFDSIPYQNFQWNSFTLPEPLYLPDGFMIGISTLGFLGLAHDDGVGDPYDFQPNTMFLSANTFTTGFTPLEEQGFYVNFMIRAFGTDYGALIYSNMDHGVFPIQPVNPVVGNKIKKPIVTLQTFNFKDSGEYLPGSLEGYSVYRLPESEQSNPQNWSEIATFVADTVVIDYNWGSLPVDTYLYAVQSVYTNDNRSDFVFSNKLVKDELTATEKLPQLHDNIFVFPNPANQYLQIVASDQILHLAVFNMFGEILLEMMPGKNKLHIDATSFQTGICYFRITTQTSEHTEKVLIRK